MPPELRASIGAALAVGAHVVLDRFHEGLQGPTHRGAAFRVEYAVEPHHTVLRLTHVEVPSLLGAIGLRQRTGGIDPMLEALGDARELPGIHRLRRLQQAGLIFAHRRGTYMLGGAGPDDGMLVAEIAVGGRRLSLVPL